MDVLMTILREERGNTPKTFPTRTNSGAALERIRSAGTLIVVSRTEPSHASRGSEYASAPQDLLGGDNITLQSAPWP
jgi:hypothetical protein